MHLVAGLAKPSPGGRMQRVHSGKGGAFEPLSYLGWWHTG